MIKIAICGIGGKMGRKIADLIAADKELFLAAGVERKGCAQIGEKIQNVIITDDVSAMSGADVVIDFTGAAGTMLLLPQVIRHKKALVIGSTGLADEDILRIKQAAQNIPIVFSPNLSVGVNLLFRLVREAAAKLKDYEVRIKEAHHIHKKDSPSGTAKKFAEIIQEQTGNKVRDIQAIREGEIVGDHEITFDNGLDTVVLSHSARTRDIFAKGAVAAAKWLYGKPAGFYNMQDVLGEMK